MQPGTMRDALDCGRGGRYIIVLEAGRVLCCFSVFLKGLSRGSVSGRRVCGMVCGMVCGLWEGWSGLWAMDGRVGS